MQLLLLLVVALAVTVALIPPLANAAGRFRLLDRPGERKVHAVPIPRIGGIALIAGTLLPLILMATQPGEWTAIYIGAALLMVMGLIDDRFGLSWPWKLAAQAVACAFAVTTGGVSIESVTLIERIDLPAAISFGLSFVFLVGVTNAINLSDGLDGLAGGTTLLCVLAIGWISFSAGDYAVASTTAALAGALLGFLRFNTHPARVFMGDSGSQALGFLAGVVAIKATQGADVAVSAALPLLLLAWPILDTLAVMIERLRNGRSPFSADRRHFHHRLLALGFDHYEAVLIIYAVQGALFLLAYFLRFESDLVIVGTFAMFSAIVIGTLEGARNGGWQWTRPAGGDTSRIAERVRWLTQENRLARACRAVFVLLLILYGALAAFSTRPVSADIGVLAAGLACMQIIAIAFGERAAGATLLRFAMFVAAAMLVYLDHQQLGALAPRSVGSVALFGVMAAVVLVRFRLSGERRFAFTTLDALVLFVAILAPILIGSTVVGGAQSPAGIGLGVFKLVVLGYALEFTFEDRRLARGGALVAALLLAFVALRSVVPM